MNRGSPSAYLRFVPKCLRSIDFSCCCDIAIAFFFFAFDGTVPHLLPLKVERTQIKV